MLRIRLSRTGKKNHPHYAVVVTEKTNPASDGNFVEKLGSYSPIGETATLTVDHERAKYWVSVGAQPTDTVARLLFKDGIKEMEKFVDATKKYNKRNKKAPVEEPEAAAPAAAEGEEAAPAAEEAPAEAPAEEAAPAKEEEVKEEAVPEAEAAAEEAPAEEAAEEEKAE